MLLISENELREAVEAYAADSLKVEDVDGVTRELWAKLTDIVIKRKVDEFVVPA
jgi:hypothetical protein